jgi:hypothetical protein
MCRDGHLIECVVRCLMANVWFTPDGAIAKMLEIHNYCRIPVGLASEQGANRIAEAISADARASGHNLICRYAGIQCQTASPTGVPPFRSSGRAMNNLPVAMLRRAIQHRHHAAALTIALALIVGTLATPLASAANVSARQLEQNSYEFVLTNPTPLTETEAQALIAISAASICKDLTPVPGKYRFDAKERIGGGATSSEPDLYRFVQEVSCVAGARAEIGERRPTLHTTEESRQVQEEVGHKSEAYLRLIAAGRLDEAYAQVSAAAMGVDEASWKSEKKAFHLAAGEPVRISIVKITVYDNPAEAPEPGLYVAADFGNEFKNIPIHCGYLMWFRPVGGNFRITREETGYVTAEQLKAIPSTQLPEIKQRLHCVAPEIADDLPPGSLPESNNSDVGYKTVAEALASLKLMKDASFSTVRGWTIITDRPHMTVWSFAPKTDPSYPSVVKRMVTAAGSGSNISMKVLCEADKASCDTLVRQFYDMNFRGSGAQLDHQ